MKSLHIEQMDEGFLITDDSGKRWAVGSPDSLIIKIKTYFGITKKWSSKKIIASPAAVSEIQAERSSSPAFDGRRSDPSMLNDLTDMRAVDAVTQPVSSQSSSIEQVQEVKDENEQTAERQDENITTRPGDQLGVLSPSDLKLPRFDYDKTQMQQYKTLFFLELPDGRVALEYNNNHYFTTKEKVMQIPFPFPRKYFSKENGWSSSVEMAFKSYRRYLAEREQSPQPEPSHIEKMFKEICKINEEQEQKPQPEPSRMEKLREIAKVNEKRWQIQEDQKDDDWKYKKILRTDTRGSHGEDFEKVEGDLNE